MNPILFAFEDDASLQVAPEELLPRLKGAGFDGFELPVHPDFLGTSGAPDVARLRSLLDQHGLSAPTAAAFWPPACDPATGEAAHGAFHWIDQVGPDLGIRIATVRTAGCSTADPTESLRVLTGVLITALNHCEPAGIDLAVEVQDGGLFGTYAHALDWLYLNVAQVGIALDTRSLAETRARPYVAVTDAGARLKVMYLNEPLESDRFNHDELLSGLKSIGYTGSLALPIPTAMVESAASVVTDLRQRWTAAEPLAAAITES